MTRRRHTQSGHPSNALALLLSDAHDLLGHDGAHWTKGAQARTAAGSAVWSTHDGAVSWSLAGALQRAAVRAHRINRPLAERAHTALRCAIGDTALRSAMSVKSSVVGDLPLDPWNDAPERTWADVQAALFGAYFSACGLELAP